MKEKFLYSIDRAEEEAEKIKELLNSGAAKNYQEANDLIEKKELMEINLEALIDESTKINEGNNGIIKRLNLDDIPERIKGYFDARFESLFDKKNEIVFKLLKIYTKGNGEKRV